MEQQSYDLDEIDFLTFVLLCDGEQPVLNLHYSKDDEFVANVVGPDGNVERCYTVFLSNGEEA